MLYYITEELIQTVYRLVCKFFTSLCEIYVAKFWAFCSICIPVDKAVVLYEPYLVERCQVLLQTSQGMHCQQQLLLLQLQPPSLVSWNFFAFVVLSKIPSISAAKKKK